ncbi:sulfurtransferase TusA family protein [Thermosulfuriphilus sp.]
MSKIKFIENIKPDVTTDIVYMMCPMHLLTLEETISQLEEGQILELLTDYDGALEDVPRWCERTGNEFLGLNEGEDHFKFYIRKRCPKTCPFRTNRQKEKGTKH